MKKFLPLIIALIMMISSTTIVNAMTPRPNAKIDPNVAVAVMDFGTHPDAVPIDINVLNAGLAANEYVTARLVATNKIDVMDRFLVEDAITAENLNTSGLIDPDTAQRIGQIVGAKYIIYGNVNDVTLSDVGANVIVGGITVCTVKSHLIIRIMDVATGEIISASKGEGKSKSSFVQVKGGPILTVEVGRTKVTQDSVHNAIRQASFDAVDILLTRLNL